MPASLRIFFLFLSIGERICTRIAEDCSRRVQLKAFTFFLAGWVADVSGSYDWTFVMSGLLQCVGSVFLYLIPIYGAMIHRRLYEKFS